VNLEIADRLRTTDEYYFAGKLREIENLRNRGVDVINLGVGIPDLAPPSEAIAALVTSAANPTNHAYQPYRGPHELRESIANWYHQQFNVSLDPNNQVLPLMGSKEAIAHLSLAYLNPGDQVLIPNPGYPVYESAARLVGADPRYYDLCEDRNWLPNIAGLRKLNCDRIKLMWISYPHMPTGAVATDDLFQQLRNFASEKGILLCNDNAYGLLGTEAPKSLLTQDHGEEFVELNSLSKSHNLSGWRFGMLVGNRSVVSAVSKVKSQFDTGMFRGIQDGAMAAMEVSPAWYQAIRNCYLRRRELTEQVLSAASCVATPEQVGMFVWARIPESAVSSKEFVDHLLTATGIFLTPGSIFGSNGERYVRASLCVSEEHIYECLSRLRLHATVRSSRLAT
jgi:LL-diaminopimelate aminotransferase